jgi:heme-degrading monooxygenase HmoA
MSIVISCFEVPEGSAAAVEPGPGYRLHRALAGDARFRYIAVGEDVPDAGSADGVAVLTGRYEVYHSSEQAAVAFDAAAHTAPIIFVNCLLVERGDEDAAFLKWREVNDYMVAKPGYRWHRLHRRADDDAPFGFVNVVEWESLPAWNAAHDDGFRALTARGRLPFTAIPTLCEVLSEDRTAATQVAGS